MFVIQIVIIVCDLAIKVVSSFGLKADSINFGHYFNLLIWLNALVKSFNFRSSILNCGILLETVRSKVKLFRLAMLFEDRLNSINFYHFTLPFKNARNFDFRVYRRFILRDCK